MVDTLPRVARSARSDGSAEFFQSALARLSPNRRVIGWTVALHSHLEAHANSPHLKAFRSLADEILDRAVEVAKWKMLR